MESVIVINTAMALASEKQKSSRIADIAAVSSRVKSLAKSVMNPKKFTQTTDYEKALTEQQLKIHRFTKENEDGLTLGFLFRYSNRGIYRNKVHFFISFWSVFMVVLATLVVKTLISNGPLIFLKMGERSLG
jgi:hypothetical protein